MRTSIRTYLIQAKRRLQQLSTSHEQLGRFVVGNESADLDSITSALIYGYIESNRNRSLSPDSLVIPIANLPAADLKLRTELTTLLKHADVDPSHLITLDDIEGASLKKEQCSWTLVDHNILTGPLTKLVSKISGVIDHHDDEGQIPNDADPKVLMKSGSCCSLVINHLRPVLDEIRSRSSSIGAAIAQDDGRLLDDTAYSSNWTAQAAKVALGPILIDTINMTDGDKVTDHDRKAVKYLEALINIAPRIGKDYDRDRFFNKLNDAKNDIDGLSIRDILRKDYKEWSEGDLKLGTAVVVKPISYLSERSDKIAEEVQAFAAEKELQLVAVMTAFETDGQFAREVALFCLGSENAVEVAKKFEQSTTSELKLEKLVVDYGEAKDILWSCTWKQNNLAASRKRTAPLLREAMRR
ncbi:hypothetical protein MRB53_038730 [Persea americana]|nr:hypothetical protein MRB53_038730 [Persea americana]